MAYSETQVQNVWEKGIVVEGQDKNILRKDSAGAWIRRERHGTEEAGGWSIDHIFPASQGGKDDLLNLQPLHWKNNKSKANDYPKYKTEVCAVENGTVENMLKELSWEITAEYQQKLRALHGR